ncbi:hypothetical protein GALMADRAFT_632536 [Galerina marginata CBS 339.88]|uniref:Uncharacterized protein n=1 Tax=Galerina marginata (strain CBS 339.88) TaxID=685588 RepID=A0A067SSC8_GALM3|nr:hypothetical protein GALMADRAFT_632536 [Galerina marginata CBS 339.88]
MGHVPSQDQSKPGTPHTVAPTHVTRLSDLPSVRARPDLHEQPKCLSVHLLIWAQAHFISSRRRRSLMTRRLSMSIAFCLPGSGLEVGSELAPVGVIVVGSYCCYYCYSSRSSVIPSFRAGSNALICLFPLPSVLSLSPICICPLLVLAYFFRLRPLAER